MPNVSLLNPFQSAEQVAETIVSRGGALMDDRPAKPLQLFLTCRGFFSAPRLTP